MVKIVGYWHEVANHQIVFGLWKPERINFEKNRWRFVFYMGKHRWQMHVEFARKLKVSISDLHFAVGDDDVLRCAECHDLYPCHVALGNLKKL